MKRLLPLHALVLSCGLTGLSAGRADETTVSLAGFTYLPRQEMANGRIGRYAVYVAADRRHWGKPVCEGVFPNTADRQTVRWSGPVRGRFLRLVAYSEVRGGPWTSVAELDILPAAGHFSPDPAPAVGSGACGGTPVTPASQYVTPARSRTVSVGRKSGVELAYSRLRPKT